MPAPGSVSTPPPAASPPPFPRSRRGHISDSRSHGGSTPCLIRACGFLPGRCHFSTFKQCQEWLSRLSRATARPAKPEDLFAFAYHAWCLGLTEEDQHTHLCQPGEARPFARGICCSARDPHPSSTPGHWCSGELTGRGMCCRRAHPMSAGGRARQDGF